MNRYFQIKRIVILTLLIFNTVYLFSQAKVQNLYEAKKYEKCIILCNKNIEENQEFQISVLYKSLCLSEAHQIPEIKALYPNSADEALNGIDKLVIYKNKNPKDIFYTVHSEKINTIIKNVLVYAESEYKTGEKKEALKLYKKLRTIYPLEKKYLFETAKVLEFNPLKAQKVLDLSEKAYYDELYEMFKNAPKYFKTEGKTLTEQSLEIIYNSEYTDLELSSILLVFLKKNYASSKKLNSLTEQFRTKFWQIDLLIKTNDLRASGYTCGGTKMNPMPPLVLDNCLCRTTQKYAELMYKENHFSHTGPDGKSPWKRAEEEGCYADGENIAAGSSTVSGVINLWMDSPGHCKNIMGQHTHMGISESGSYWVQMFR